MPLVLGAGILYWMYRGEDWQTILHVMTDEMDWTWMLLSFPFGILAQMFRGWRWRQTLEPVGEHPRHSVSIHSIFVSYAASLVVPRVGEFTRCGVLNRYDGVSFPKALGTVVTERAIDSLLVMGITALVLLLEMSTFGMFFRKTGTNLQSILGGFSWAGYLVVAICGLAILILLHFLLHKLSIYDKVRATLTGIWQGVISLKDVRNIPLFVFFTLAIWVSYFLHYYLTFFCFDFTADLGLGCALVTFIVGSIAVIVPTPNGAGAQRCRSLAFCREDHAHSLWRSRRAGPVFRAHRPYRADPARHRLRHLCLAGPELHDSQENKMRMRHLIPHPSSFIPHPSPPLFPKIIWRIVIKSVPLSKIIKINVIRC